MEPSIKEQRIRSITSLYYSRPDIQNAIFEFSRNREVVPSYMMESFGKRPDSIQYPADLFQMVQKGATSFHCSEELWSDPLQLSTGMTETQLNELRIGWDLLIDIDSKYIDYSKISAEIIINFLKFHGIKNIGVKFSGSRGFHIIIPCKAFPKEINNVKTSGMFPEWPRIITKYIMEKTKTDITRKILDLGYEKDLEQYETTKKYIKREAGAVTPDVISQTPLTKLSGAEILKFSDTISGMKIDKMAFNKDVAPDIILVSPRHLFRMPYSLHEKTALASIVLDKDKISEFQIQDANPLKITKENINSFMPESEEGEASELLLQSLDWNKETQTEPEYSESKQTDFKPIKLDKISDEFFPPSIQEILKGVKDGRKRAVFVLINLFRSIGMEKEELEKRIYDWNKKNEVPLKDGYIKSQLSWSYRNKVAPPYNFDKDFYKGLGIIPTPEELSYKNPVNYVVKKTLGNQFSGSNHSNKDNFKKKK